MYQIDLRPQPHTNSIRHIKIMKYKKSPKSTTLSRALNVRGRNGKRGADSGLQAAGWLRRQGGSTASPGQQRTQLGHFTTTVLPQPLPSWKPQQNNTGVCKASIPLSCRGKTATFPPCKRKNHRGLCTS